MSALDFLFQGTPPTQVTNTGQSASNVPAWLQQYAQGILSEGAGLASQAYPTYGGPMVSGLTPQSTQAGGVLQSLQGQYQPTLSSAINLATQGAQPGAIGGALGSLPQAQQMVAGSAAPTAAMMNPYAQNVIKQAEDTASRYFTNTLQPQINNQFTTAGQFGSSANQRAQDLTAQQLTQQIQDTAGSALSNAFTNAQQANLAAGTGLGQLAQTQGGLGYEQGILGLQGAGALGSLATTGQGLGIQGAGALNAYGQQVQQNQQQNLDTAYQQFLQQQQFPYQQLGWLSGLMSGTIPGTTPMGQTTSQQMVPFQQGTGVAPIGNVFGALSTLTQP
jgi:hypothetical protein